MALTRLIDFLRRVVYLEKASRITGRNLSIVIPTKNSAGHIDIVLRHYRRLGLDPMVFVDADTTDNTVAICKRMVSRVHLISNPLQRTEGMIEAMSQACPTDWVLRFDDDEIPTRALIDYANSMAASENERRRFAFTMRNVVVMWDNVFQSIDVFDHIAWRLYNRRFVRWITDLHTPGIEADEETVAPPEIFFIHLQWIVRSFDHRKSKIDHYYKIMNISGEYWRSYYLAVGADFENSPRTDLADPDLASVAKDLVERFGASPA